MTSKLWWPHSDRYYRRQRKKQEKQMQKSQRKALKAWNARLPAPRSSKPSCFPRRASRKVCTQAASPFFSKLSLEIREQIYMEAIGGEELRFRVPNEHNAISGGDKKTSKKMLFKLTCSGGQKVTGFPRSCKIAYLEAASYIYTSNTFQFSGTTSFWCFTRLLSPQNLSLIQAIHLQYTYGAAYSSRDMRFGPPPWGCHTWQATCGEIASLAGLKRLRLDFAFWSIGVDKVQEEMFFGALEGMGVEVWVRVNWPRRSGMQEEGCFSFKLMRDVRFQEGRNGWFSLAESDEEAGEI